METVLNHERKLQQSKTFQKVLHFHQIIFQVKFQIGMAHRYTRGLVPGDEFSSDLCSCCAPPGGWSLCCCTLWLPCITLGDNNEFVGGPCGFIGGVLAGVAQLVTGWPLVGCFCSFYHARQTRRMKVHFLERHVPPESHTCKDLCVAFWCTGCLHCQVRREQMLLEYSGLDPNVPAMHRQGPPCHPQHPNGPRHSSAPLVGANDVWVGPNQIV